MSCAINLIGTRAVGGGHAALQRWYSDHVHLLLRAPELQHATLYQRVDGDAAPEYLCVYAFADEAAFTRFDSGPTMADTRRLSDAAPGRDSVERVERTQYQRWLSRAWGNARKAGADSVFHAQRFSIDAAAPDAVLRWLNDGLQCLSGRVPLRCACLYGAHGDGPQRTELFVLLEVQGTQPLPADAWSVGDEGSGSPLPPMEARYGTAAAVAPRWSAAYREWGAWSR